MSLLGKPSTCNDLEPQTRNFTSRSTESSTWYIKEKRNYQLKLTVVHVV